MMVGESHCAIIKVDTHRAIASFNPAPPIIMGEAAVSERTFFRCSKSAPSEDQGFGANYLIEVKLDPVRAGGSFNRAKLQSRYFKCIFLKQPVVNSIFKRVVFTIDPSSFEWGKDF